MSDFRKKISQIVAKNIFCRRWKFNRNRITRFRLLRACSTFGVTIGDRKTSRQTYTRTPSSLSPTHYMGRALSSNKTPWSCCWYW